MNQNSACNTRLNFGFMQQRIRLSPVFFTEGPAWGLAQALFLC